jgi:hypothetical protein
VDEVVTTVQSLLPTPPPLEVLPSPSASPLLRVDVGGVTLGIG